MKSKIISAAALVIVGLAAFAGTALADRVELGVDEQRSTSSSVHRQDAAVQADADGASFDAGAVSDHKAVGVHVEADREARTVEATPCVGAYQIELCHTATNADGADREPERRLPVTITIGL